MKTFVDIFRFIAVLAIADAVMGASMLYKKVDDEKYEPGTSVCTEKKKLSEKTRKMCGNIYLAQISRIESEKTIASSLALRVFFV